MTDSRMMTQLLSNYGYLPLWRRQGDTTVWASPALPAVHGWGTPPTDGRMGGSRGCMLVCMCVLRIGWRMKEAPLVETHLIQHVQCALAYRWLHLRVTAETDDRTWMMRHTIVTQPARWPLPQSDQHSSSERWLCLASIGRTPQPTIDRPVHHMHTLAFLPTAW